MTVPDASQGTATVYLTNSQTCSAGTGPGSATLPWAEAKALVDAGLAIWGDQPPMNMFQGAHPVTPP